MLKVRSIPDRRLWRAIAPGPRQRLAAVFTQNISREEIRAIREATNDIINLEKIEKFGNRALNNRLTRRWQELAGAVGTRFIDRTGRVWNPRSYIKMLVKTNVARIERESYHQALVDNGDDLAMVRNVGDNCPICTAFNYVIYSISGRSRLFPSYRTITEAGVFHPNCDCLQSRVDPGLHAERIELQRAQGMIKADWFNLDRVQRFETREAA